MVWKKSRRLVTQLIWRNYNQLIQDVTGYVTLTWQTFGLFQGGLEGLPILLCAASVSPFATYPITFLCGAEFWRIFNWFFLLEFGAMEPKKQKCISFRCLLFSYLILEAMKRFATLEIPHIFDEFIWNGWRVIFHQESLSQKPSHFSLTWSICRRNNMTSKKNKLWMRWMQRSPKVASYCLRLKQLKIPLLLLNELCNVLNIIWRADSVTFCWTNDKVVAFFLSWKVALFHFYSNSTSKNGSSLFPSDCYS